MDALLVEETYAASAITSGLRGIATALAERVIASGVTNRIALRRAVPKLLPTSTQILTVVGPPISQLLAATREQTLPVIARQLRTCQQVIGPHAIPIAGAGVLAAEAIAPDLEARYFATACARIATEVTTVASMMKVQTDIWAVHPEETPTELARRWTSEDLVRLAGAPGRGVLWTLRSRCIEEARAGSVAVTNGLLLAGYQGWSRAAAAS
jgi:hypothetical protein